MRNKLLLLCCLAALAGCYKDTEEELYPDWSNNGSGGTGGGCDTANATYATVIQPILTQNCATSGCHDAAGLGGGYNFTNYQGAKSAVDNNRLMGAVRHEPGFSPMPKGGAKMSDCNIAKIGAWVNAGSPNN